MRTGKSNASILRHVVTVALFAAVVSTFADYPARPPKFADVVGVWSGYSNHHDFLRLALDRDGTGYLSIISVVRDSPVDVYRVRTWTLSEWSVTLELEPITREAEPFQFQRVSCYYHHMECEFAGKGWDRKTTLFAERDVQALGERAQKATDQERKKKRRE
jgi:hypothetical protein